MATKKTAKKVTKKAKAATKAATKAPRSGRLDSRDLAIELLAAKDNAVAFAEVLATARVSFGEQRLREAARKIEQSVPTLCGALDAAGLLTVGKQGRSPPAVGDARVYSVQAVANDPAFIRLPVSALGLVKGDRVAARFAAGSITVSRA